MSKIEFYKKLKSVLEEDDDFNFKDNSDTSISKFVKDYVNNLDAIPSIDDALDFIYKNYRIKKQSSQSQPQSQSQPKFNKKFTISMDL